MSSQYRQSQALLLLFVVFFSRPISADVVYFQDGRIVEGHVYSTADELRFVERNGDTHVLGEDEVCKIIYAPFAGQAEPSLFLERTQSQKSSQISAKDSRNTDGKVRKQRCMQQFGFFPDEPVEATLTPDDNDQTSEPAQPSQIPGGSDESSERKSTAPLNASMKEQTPWKNIARSALLPGWGQYHSGQGYAAYGIGFSFLSILAETARQYELYTKTRRQYEQEAQQGFAGIVILNKYFGSVLTTPVFVVDSLRAAQEYREQTRTYNDRFQTTLLLYFGQLLHISYLNAYGGMASDEETTEYGINFLFHPDTAVAEQPSRSGGSFVSFLGEIRLPF